MNYTFIILVVVVFGLVYLFTFLNALKKKKKFFDENPNAIKIYAEWSNFILWSKNVDIISVNNEEPHTFATTKGKGVYCVPGKSTLNVQYTSTRVGILYKSVTKSTPMVKLEVDLKEGKNYKLSYNTSEEKFNIEEVN